MKKGGNESILRLRDTAETENKEEAQTEFEQCKRKQARLTTKLEHLERLDKKKRKKNSNDTEKDETEEAIPKAEKTDDPELKPD